MRLIDADVLMKDIEYYEQLDTLGATYLKKLLEDQPLVDPVKHGYWKSITYKDYRYFECSVCGEAAGIKGNYCSHCGAVMDAKAPPKGRWRLLNGKWTCSACGNRVDWPLKVCNECEREMEIEL